MEGLFSHVSSWHWWGLAIILLILEVFAPGTFFLWPAMAAAVIGVLLMIAPAMAWELQLLLFAVLSVVSIVAWRMYHKDRPQETDQPLLNKRGQQYVGRIVTVSEAIQNGYGRVRVDDTFWRAEGPDMPAGSKAKVISVDGVVLKVEACTGSIPG